MSKDEKSSEHARVQLLEEIRKRAEAAELARIEAEELRLALESPVHTSSARESSPSDGALSSEVIDLRGELAAALVNEDLDRATALHAELSALLPDDPLIAQCEVEIGKLRERLSSASARSPVASARKAELMELFARANEAYQQERYDDALRFVEPLLALEPENVEAHELRRSILKAKDLADRLTAEEEKQKNDEAEDVEQKPVLAPEPAPKASSAREPEGSAAARQQGFPETAAETEERDEPGQSRSWVRTVASWLSTYKWSLVAGGVLLFLGLQTASVLYLKLRTTVFPRRSTILVVPASWNSASPAAKRVTAGMTAEFIAHLAHMPHVDIFAAPTSLRTHDGDYADRQRLASELGAEYLLSLDVSEGAEASTVRWSLVEVGSGSTVLQRTEHSALSLAPIAAAKTILQVLDIHPIDSDKKPILHSPADSVYRLYLSARGWLFDADTAALDSAARFVHRALQSDSLFAPAYVLSGWIRLLCYEASRDTSSTGLQEMQSDLQRGVGLGVRSSETLALWGMIHYYHARYREALERLSEASQVAPSDAEAQRRLALALFRVGRVEKAMDAARRVVQYDPSNPTSRSLLGTFSLLLGDEETALREFQAEFDLTSAQKRKDPALFVAALVENNQHELALDIVKKRASENPEDIAALYDLGRMYQLAGKPKRLWDEALGRARALVLQQLKQKPTQARLLASLALIETRMGHFKEGMDFATRAVALAPKSYETLYDVAKVLALQKGPVPETYANLAQAVYRRFVPEQLLDLDLAVLRRDQAFLTKITQ